MINVRSSPSHTTGRFPTCITSTKPDCKRPEGERIGKEISSNKHGNSVGQVKKKPNKILGSARGNCPLAKSLHNFTHNASCNKRRSSLALTPFAPHSPFQMR